MMRRRGLSLIELLVAMSVSFVVASGAVVLIAAALRLGTSSQQQTLLVNTAGRMASQFRDDVHQATARPVLAEGKREITLTLPEGHSVVWRAEPCRVVRVEKATGTADREQSFTQAETATATFELEEQNKAAIVCLRVQSSDGAGPVVSIEALASRDRQLSVAEVKP